MYIYSTMQWILFFYIYCFIGWIWETSYVSIKNKSYSNRGFMHGPFLPIYGSGAIIILLATIPVKHTMLLVFLFGMIAATILEYVTGAAMLQLFHVRYWDYSNAFCNFKGHICLKCSLAWGGFSILMVNVIHVPIERAVLAIPKTLEEILTFVLTLAIVSDFSISFREAMDFRRVLDTIARSNEELQRIKKRLDVVSAFAQDDYEKWKLELEDKAENMELRLSETAEEAKLYLEKRVQEYQNRKKAIQESNVANRVRDIMKRNPIVTSDRYKETLEFLKNFERR